MKKIGQLIIVSSFALSLIGCENLNKQDIGMLSGGVAGGLLGSQLGGGTGKLVAVGAGALAGAYLGGVIGKSMDEQDRLKVEAALERNRTNQPVHWQNPDNGYRYTMTPKKTYRARHQYCREYTMQADIAGKKQQTYGKACRQPDGTWKVQG
jgi:surface antigen